MSSDSLRAPGCAWALPGSRESAMLLSMTENTPPPELEALQSAHDATTAGQDLATAYASAVAYLRANEPSARIKGRTTEQKLATIKHAQGVLRRRAAWERGTMQGLMAATKRKVERQQRQTREAA